MKALFTVLSLTIATLTFGQTNLTGTSLSHSDDVKVESMSIHVKVDSAEEIASTFKTADIESILDELKPAEAILFKITCNGKTMSNGIKSHASYAVKGNTNDKEGFVKRVKKMRKAAINYYKNKQ